MSIQLPGWTRDFQRPCRYKFAYGGRGSGKSWAFARLALLYSLGTKSRILCCRELQVSITDSVHKLLSDQISAMGIDAHFDVGRSYIRCLTSGAEFVFKGLRTNAAEIKSMEDIGLCWVEEAQGVSAASWELLTPTIRAAGSEIWGTFNPSSPTDYVWAEWCASPRTDVIARAVNWSDNPWFPAELEQERVQMLGTDPDRYSHVWGGGFRTISDAQVLKGKWCVRDFEAATGWDGPYYGADWGFAKDPTTLVRAWVHDSTLWIDHEAYGVGVDIDKTGELFDGVPGARDHVIYADSARPETISYLKRAGWTRIRAVDKWSGSVADGISYLRGFDRIVIHPRCKHTADEASKWGYKVDRLSGDVMPVLLDQDNHTMDALRYALSKMIRGKSSGFAA